MNTLRKIAALCMLVGGAWLVYPALADDLPEMGAAPQAQGQMSGSVSDRVNKDAVCTNCHDESEAKPVLSIAATKHGVKGDARTPSCQSCHGESDAHVKNVEGKATRPAPDVLFGMKSGKDSSFGRTDAATQNQSCAKCHSNAGGKRNFWAGSQHQTSDVPCAACHEVHAKQDKVLAKATQPDVCFACHKDQRAQSKQTSHHPIGEGKVACSDCHNPHGSPGPKLLKKNTTNETCFLCHAEKRGPFLWEHQPVTEDCANCHTPHGSNITPLLKSRPPFLCQECHNGPHNSKTPAGRNVGGYQNGLPRTGPTPPPQNPSTQATARGCLNCHVLVHGSNHPAGSFFHR